MGLHPHHQFIVMNGGGGEQVVWWGLELNADFRFPFIEGFATLLIGRPW